MRKLVAPLVAAGLLLGGCGSPSQQGQGAPSSSGPASAASAPSSVSGTVTLQHPPSPPSPQAQLQLTLVDVTQQPGVPVNSQTYRDPKFPLQFKVDFKPSQIRSGDIYVVQAEMHDNGRAYTTNMQPPVLTHGAPAKADLVLTAVPTPAEKMLADYKQAEARIGGMKVTSGTALSPDISRGWQVFSDNHGVEFIRELVDAGDKGFTSTDYAYKDGLPWVVMQQKMPKKGAPPQTVDRAGWDDNGSLVLQEQVNNGKTGTLPESTAKALHQKAEALYKEFNKKKPRKG
jgi:putative lipoprotein